MFQKVTFLLLFCLNLGPNSNYEKTYHDNGNVASEGWKMGNNKVRYWKYYHPNGQIASEGHYKANKKQNYWYFYHQEGFKQKEGHFINDRPSKWWSFYDKTGTLIHKCQLQNGIKNGYCLMYKKKKIVSAEKYQNGKKINEWFDFKSFKRDNNLSDLK
ncbi:hypothetical protein ABN763_16285 [Spongiivirga sp. MCCC 1A20706]|uniref:toxin-antitoxin system YwqK family antitoxin n=1 Tax=Spongiivirga sp. MCCC 1A20706 TaxID=3160963 RepID=UPI0039774A1F